MYQHQLLPFSRNSELYLCACSTYCFPRARASEWPMPHIGWASVVGRWPSRSSAPTGSAVAGTTTRAYVCARRAVLLVVSCQYADDQ